MQNKNTLTKVDPNNKNTFIICNECNKPMPQITHTHLKHAHSLTINEYITKHNITKADLYSNHLRELRKVTKLNMIAKYGDDEGTNRWNLYIKKQAVSNSFEYKKKKYGWTEQQYNEYNNNRASTKQNFINRHGLEKGTQKWNEYRKTQSKAGVTLDYFVEKYGEENGAIKYKDLCNKKSNTLNNFIQRYGKIIGNGKWNRYLEQQSKYKRQSKLANELFDNIHNKIDKNIQNTVYYDSKNYEYFFAKTGYQTMFVDFCELSKRRIIEFAGDYWHGNPEIYKPDFINTRAKATAKELYEKTIRRNLVLEDIHGCKVLLIWENDYIKNKEEVISKCFKFINE